MGLMVVGLFLGTGITNVVFWWLFVAQVAVRIQGNERLITISHILEEADSLKVVVLVKLMPIIGSLQNVVFPVSGVLLAPPSSNLFLEIALKEYSIRIMPAEK